MRRLGITRPDLLGFLGVAIFAGTYPATRIAVAGGVDPLLNASSRILGAGVLALVVLTATRAPFPGWALLPRFALAGLGVGIIFPLCLGFALQSVPASHGAVVMAALPLVTTLYACLRGQPWPARKFWWAGAAAGTLVLLFSWRHATGGGNHDGGWADLLLVVAMLGAALGYVEGSRLTTTERHGWQVISWALVALLPVVGPVAVWQLATLTTPITAGAWTALGYATVFSMYLGFFPWYRAMLQGGVARISQIQYLQPFLAIGYSVLLLGERVDAVDLALVLGVVGTIAWGRRK